MNLRDFYANVRNTISMIEEPYVVLVSKTTPDGGKPGVATLVSRETAGRLIVEDKARLASGEESAAYFSEDRAKREQAESERRFSVGQPAEPLEQFSQIRGSGGPHGKAKQLK